VPPPELGATIAMMPKAMPDTHSLASFKRHSSQMLRRMKRTRRPIMLTIKGNIEAVLIDARDFRYVAERLDVLARIRRGIQQAHQGLGRSVRDVFDDLQQ
jgi:hypothetical protein